MRIAIALLGTAVWAFFGWFYVFEYIGWGNFQSYNPDEVGEFFIGFFGPLGFLWVLIGYFQQGAELRHHTEALLEQGDELRRVVEMAEHQARGIQANEFHVRRDSFLRFAELTTRDLNSIAVEIAHDTASKDLMERTQNSYVAGNKDAFFGLLIRSFLNQEIGRVLGFLKTTKDFPNNILVYRENYDKMIQEAEACDMDGYLKGYFESSSVGRLNEIFRDVQQVHAEEPPPAEDAASVAEAVPPVDAGDR